MNSTLIKKINARHIVVMCLLVTLWLCVSVSVKAAHPNLVITQDDVSLMRAGLLQSPRFKAAYEAKKQAVDQQLAVDIDVPEPRDGGGGYTHERHKKNYQLMFDAGVIFQISEEQKYADAVADILLQYADLYPRLPLHPKRKTKSQNPGKLFWQSLNEAVWLVYTIQAYDLVYNAIDPEQRQIIEQQLLRPAALFLSEGQPSTFNKVHNHGTWATAGVGMAGYVLNEPEWVERALYDLEKSGKGGFLTQLDQLFSPQGYYNEGPYYQRYALMPFITFAKAIENNQPERQIFDYRDQILLKAIDTTIQLSYNGLFFPINDAIKSKGIDTIELVHGVTIAYGLTQQPGFLDIARQQDQIVLSGDGYRVAKALDEGKAEAYPFRSTALGDGADGRQGALVIMRNASQGHQTLVFKPAAQGLGHGHFDKLHWLFYDKNQEIVGDYGAARFLNVEAKFGGRYLPENNSYAKQTIAHNTLVVDEISHFNGKVKTGNLHAPELLYFAHNQQGSVSKATINSAYPGVVLSRTMAMVSLPGVDLPIVVDIFEASSDEPHQYDLPLHYHGQLIETNFSLNSNTTSMRPLGDKNGYQHLWLMATASPDSGLAKATWLNDNGRFYTLNSLVADKEQWLFTQIGANDPDFNLRHERAFVRRLDGAKKARFVSVLEIHGDYNPSKEYTLQAGSQLSELSYHLINDVQVIDLTLAGKEYMIVIDDRPHNAANGSPTIEINNQSYTLNGRLNVFAKGNMGE